MKGVFYLLSQVLAGLGVAFLAPAAIGLHNGEVDAAQVFLTVAGLVVFLAGGIFFALRGFGRRLDRAAGFMLVLAVWCVPPAVAAFPLMAVTGVDYATALFEAVSAYTTTGASALPDGVALGRAGIFFRAELQWLGGLMTILTVVVVLAPAGLGGLSDVTLARAAGEDRLDRVLATVRQVILAYLAVTAVCIGLLLASSIAPFDALCLALSTVSTGGFTPGDRPLAEYESPFGLFVIALFMLVGATSVLWHRMVFTGRWQDLRQHRESYWVIGMALLVGLAYGVSFVLAPTSTDRPLAWSEFGNELFTGISLVSTTGFQTREQGMQALPPVLVLLVALIGGGTLSAAGGIKYYRAGGMLVQTMHELKRLMYPHSVGSTRFGSVDYGPDLMKGIWSSLLAALLVVILAALLLAPSVESFEGALTAAIAAFANIGPLYSAVGNQPGYAEFGPGGKLVMIATMILGRVEVLTLFGAVNLAYWRS